MKTTSPRIILMVLALGACGVAFAQKKQIQQTDFVTLKKGSVAFSPLTIKDVNRDPTKTVNDIITLPNGKKVKLGDYLNTINTIEKNLSAIGYDKKLLKGKTVVAAYKTKLPAKLPKKAATAQLKPLAKPVVDQRFKTTSITKNLLIPSKNLGKFLPKTTQVVDHNETPEPFDFTVGDYGVKVAPSFTMHGKTEPLTFANDNQRHPDTLTKMVKAKNNEYSLGLNVDITTDIPVLGNVNVYSLQSKFEAKSNKDSSLKSNVRLKVLGQVLITENKSQKTDKLRFTQQRDYNVNKLIGAADIFMYGLNLLSPVNFYLASKVGGSFDVDLSRTGITGEMGPSVAQSIILESSVLDLAGSGFLQNNALDAGVGGELKLINGTLEFGGSTGITAVNKKVKLLNDVYNAFDVDLLKGRLYTYYSYPVYECNSIFSALDPNCWGVKTIEHNLFNTGSALNFQLVLVDNNQNIDLNW